MTEELTDDAARMLTGAGRHWGWPLGFGLITAILGIAVLGWPGRTVQVVAVLFGVQLIVAGIFYFVVAVATDEAGGGRRILLALLGVLSVIAGLYALRNLNVTIAALALILGIFWIVNGLIQLFAAITDTAMRGRGWTALIGLLSIAAGVVVFVWPGISLVTLALVLGAWLVVLGVLEIVLALQLRSLGQRSARTRKAT